MESDESGEMTKPKIGATRRPYCVWTCPCRPQGWIYRERGLFHRHCHVVHPNLNPTLYEDVTGPYTPQRRLELASLYKSQPKAKPSSGGPDPVADFKASSIRFRAARSAAESDATRKRRRKAKKVDVDDDDIEDEYDAETQAILRAAQSKRRKKEANGAKSVLQPALPEPAAPKRASSRPRRARAPQGMILQTPEELSKVFLVTQALLSIAGTDGFPATTKAAAAETKDDFSVGVSIPVTQSS
eukprot:Opistho-1_new@76212